ncbi:MAG: hypothetical protein EXR50_00485 [Dehalococcoidia bacterium]|nr:hypothetical protein [Dehalococcoidia bacterium]
MTLRQGYRADIVIRSSNGSPICVVEIKNLKNLSREDAMELRSNMIAAAMLTNVSYSMILSQDKGFLWKESKQKKPNSPPLLEFPMDNVVTRYLPYITKQNRLRETELELIVLGWLSELVIAPPAAETEPEKSLDSVGFRQAIKRARITAEDAV